ncbi:unnamed protein product [Blepharisma stoltei]|uniref:Uncharacterized protein n=1 Tax=Blepharisma stoltei TaxID=1481888 RepID=A0AAU9JT37_9CILI|nr:unnamed protein product [Blepharisma stoltei]
MAATNFIERFKNKVSTIGKSGEIEFDSSRPALKANSAQFHKSIMQLSASNIIRNNLQSPKVKTFVSSRPVKLTAKDDSPTSPKSHAGTFQNYKPDTISEATTNTPKPTLKEQKIKRKSSHSAAPLRNKQSNEAPKSSDGATQSFETRYVKKQQTIDFSPYTLNDYHMIKSDEYYELGGLGCATVGTEEWTKRKEMQDRRKDYARQVKYTNAANLPPSGARKSLKSIEKEPSKMQKANEFAKNIPKPKLRSPPMDVKSTPLEVKESSSEKTFGQLEYHLDKHDNYRALIDEIKADLD